MTIAIRTMTVDDVPLGMALKDLAGWNQTQADWLRFLAMEPDGCFVAHWDGRPVATTVTTVFEDVGWIAMVLVEKAVRGRGIGTRLVQHALGHLERRPVRTVRLDATPLGRPVYEGLGFVPEYEVARWEGVAPGAAPEKMGTGTSLDTDLTRFSHVGSEPVPILSGPRVRPVTADELDAVAELDRRVTGTNRRRLIEQLYRQQPEAMRGERADGQLAGYATLRLGTRAVQIGPAVAVTPEVGTALAEAALRLCVGRPVYIDIPPENTVATSWARSKGFDVQRHWMRMRRGKPVQDHPARIWASSGPENG
jgi:GNAT superfamily N-acetyltransferase